MTMVSSRPTITHFSYFSTAGKPTADLVQRMREALSDAKYCGDDVRFDTMIGTGLSGVLVIPCMAKAMRKHWAIIRKENDGSHAGNQPLEGTVGRRFLIVDDTIDSGLTVANILRRMTDAWDRHGGGTAPVFVGTYQYCNMRFQSAEWHLRDRECSPCIGDAIREYQTHVAMPRQREFCACGCGLPLW